MSLQEFWFCKPAQKLCNTIIMILLAPWRSCLRRGQHGIPSVPCLLFLAPWRSCLGRGQHGIPSVPCLFFLQRPPVTTHLSLPGCISVKDMPTPFWRVCSSWKWKLSSLPGGTPGLGIRHLRNVRNAASSHSFSPRCQSYLGPDLASVSPSLGKPANHIEVQIFKDVRTFSYFQIARAWDCFAYEDDSIAFWDPW